MRFRMLLATLMVAIGCFAQLSQPLIGWVCDRAGFLRPVHGTTGAFVLGPAVAEQVASAAFDGRQGVAWRDGQRYQLSAAGELTENAAAPEPAPGATVEGATLILEPRSVRLEFPQEIERVDPMGDGWLAVRTSEAIYAVRTEEGRESLFRLPEAQQ